MFNINIDYNKFICIIGIGNDLRSDDGVGPMLIEELKKKKLGKNISLINASLAPENFIGKIISLKPDIVIFVDAQKSDKKPGELNVIVPDELNESFLSTHGLPLRFLIETIMNATAAKVYIIGIEVGNGELAEGLSPEVEESLNELVEFFCSKGESCVTQYRED